MLEVAGIRMFNQGFLGLAHCQLVSLHAFAHELVDFLHPPILCVVLDVVYAIGGLSDLVPHSTFKLLDRVSPDHLLKLVQNFLMFFILGLLKCGLQVLLPVLVKQVVTFKPLFNVASFGEVDGLLNHDRMVSSLLFSQWLFLAHLIF